MITERYTDTNLSFENSALIKLFPNHKYNTHLLLFMQIYLLQLITHYI